MHQLIRIITTCLFLFSVGCSSALNDAQNVEQQTTHINADVTDSQSSYVDNYGTGSTYRSNKKSSYKSSGDVLVRSYTRKDGTRVKAHSRSRARR